MPVKNVIIKEAVFISIATGSEKTSQQYLYSWLFSSTSNANMYLSEVGKQTILYILSMVGLERRRWQMFSWRHLPYIKMEAGTPGKKKGSRYKASWPNTIYHLQALHKLVYVSPWSAACLWSNGRTCARSFWIVQHVLIKSRAYLSWRACPWLVLLSLNRLVLSVRVVMPGLEETRLSGPDLGSAGLWSSSPATIARAAFSSGM